MADDAIAALAARLDALEQRNRDLEAEVRTLRSAAAPPPPASAPAPVGEQRIGRRQALRTGAVGAVAAAAGLVVADAQPAAASNGDAVKAGQDNFATIRTSINAFGGPNAESVLFVTDSGISSTPGLLAPALFVDTQVSNGLNAGIGVHSTKGSGLVLDVSGQSATPGGTPDYAAADVKFTNGIGLRVREAPGTNASANYPAYFTTEAGTALYAQSGSGNGAIIYGDNFQLYLGTLGFRPAPSLDSTFHIPAEIVCDVTSNLWYCTLGGTPGTWRRLSGPGTAGALTLLPTPVRVYDSRPGTSPNVGSKTKLVANTTRVLDLKANNSGVPADATGALLTVLLVNATSGNGNFTVWSNGTSKPLANTMVWGGATGRFSATAISSLATGSGGQVQVNASLATDLVLDVVGYYR